MTTAIRNRDARLSTCISISCDPALETVSLSLWKLARRTAREVLDDDVFGLAAQLSYYFLSLFPAILLLLALASFFPLSNITDDVDRSLGAFVSPQVLELIQEQMRAARQQRERRAAHVRRRWRVVE